MNQLMDLVNDDFSEILKNAFNDELINDKLTNFIVNLKIFAERISIDLKNYSMAISILSDNLTLKRNFSRQYALRVKIYSMIDSLDRLE